MKYLLLLGIVAAAVWLWRSNRAAESGGQRAAPPPPPQPPRLQQMARCAVCRLHFPAADAVSDRQGRVFCSPEHRAQARD